MIHVARNSVGMVLASIVALPRLAERWRPAIAATWLLPTALWIVPTLRFAGP